MRIGEYETSDLLGKGGMSEVYKAEHVRIGSLHALKRYAYPHEDPEVRQRFEQEGRLLARLDHPRIVKVTDFGTDPESGCPYFVMSFVSDAEGRCRSLADVPAVELDEELIGRWYDDMREALAYIHARGIVHRDLKLQNVLIGPDGHAVLTDFGISRVFEPADGKSVVTNLVDTVLRMRDGKSMVMGSIGYMAPELEMGVAASPQSDWYALGVIVYKLLTGTWCDARTDILAALETYDPVWSRILPGLLHANPAGRSCVGYAEEKERLREEAELELENLRILKKRRRFVRRWVSVGCVGGFLLLCGIGVWHYGGLARELMNARRLLAQPSFDGLFEVPAGAGETATEYMPSRAQFESAIVDACVLTEGLFAEFRKGTLTKQALKMRLGRMMIKARADDDGLFRDLPDSYMPSGESAALSLLFKNAANRLSQ